MVIREEIRINAPLQLVWRVFSSLADWNEWNTVCQSCLLVEGDEMEVGTCFSFTLRPYFLPVRITPKITQCDHGQKVVWEGGRLGIYARHTFSFEETQGGVALVSYEEFTGPLLWVSRLLGMPKRLHGLSRRLLSDIKRQSEGCRQDF